MSSCQCIYLLYSFNWGGGGVQHLYVILKYILILVWYYSMSVENTKFIAKIHKVLNGMLISFSIFVWSNESINIWSHLLGFLVFLLLLLYDNLVILPRTNSSFSDYFVVSLGLLCYQVCLLSAVSCYTGWYTLPPCAHLWSALQVDNTLIVKGEICVSFVDMYAVFSGIPHVLLPFGASQSEMVSCRSDWDFSRGHRMLPSSSSLCILLFICEYPFSVPGFIVYISNLYSFPSFFQVWRDVYFIIITILTISTIVIQLHQKFFSHGWFRYRILIYVFLVGYGVLPTIHWIYLNGGPQAEIVQVCKLSLSFNSISLWHVLSLKDNIHTIRRWLTDKEPTMNNLVL